MRGHAKAASTGSTQVTNRRAFIFLALAVLSLTMTLGVSSAYGYGKAITGSWGALEVGGFGFPLSGVAVDETSDDVYVFDSGRTELMRFDADGGYISSFGAPGSGNGEFSGASGPAVDQTDGSVYVIDASNNRIQKFDSSNNFLFAFGADVDPGGGTGFEICAPPTTCQAGTNGSEDGEFNGIGGLAVGPGGNVFVSDSGNDRIQKFDSAGNFLSKFGVTGTEDGELSGPGAIGVDSGGDIYVADSIGRIQRFDSVGAFEASLALPATNFAVDRLTNHLYLDHASGAIAEYGSDGALVDIHGSGNGAIGGYGLAINSSTNRLYSAYQFRVFVLDNVQPPDVTVLPATDVGSHTAVLHATVNPHGTPNHYRFEYSKDGLSWTIGPEGDAASGTTDLAISRVLGLLDPNTLYHVRLAAKPNGGGDFVTSAETTFTTVGIPPAILTLQAADVTDSTATLHGRLIANSSPTTYRFEFGPTTAYGSTIPVPDGNAGSGTDQTIVSETILGLPANTTYHYRISASNAFGTTTGADQTFTTKGGALRGDGLPDGRVYEKVTPNDKNGADIERSSDNHLLHFVTQVATSGNAVVYASKGNFGGDAGTLFSQYIASRGPSGWNSRGLTSRVPPTPTSLGYSYYEWFSDDLSKGGLSAFATLHPGGPESDEDAAWLYLRDTASPNDVQNSAFQLLTAPVTPVLSTGEVFRFSRIAEMTNDGSRLVIDSNLQLTADAPPQDPSSPNNRGVYEIVDGQPHFVGFRPDGTVAPSTAAGSGGLVRREYPGDNVISDDGSRLFFSEKPEEGYRAKIYVRENGATTVEVGSGIFQSAKASDGSVAFFTSLDRLTDDATANPVGCPGPVTSQCPDLYRWDADAPPGEQLVDLTTADPAGGGVLATIGVSADATKVYFVAKGDLAPGATRGMPNIYLWQEGEGIRYIATLSSQDSAWERLLGGAAQEGNAGGYGGTRVTPDGSHLLFESRASITPYGTNGHLQIYIYSLATEEVRCVSCNPRAVASTADAAFSLPRVAPDLNQSYGFSDPTLSLPKNLSVDGRRVFFDSVEALVPGDTNGMADVYEWQDGVLHLISTGDSGSDSTFIGASSDGDDVFVATREPLTRSDNDSLVDIFDARVGGIEEPAPIPGCSGDECQGTPVSPPRFDAPTSADFVGRGNSPAKIRKRCPKGTRQIKVRPSLKCKKRYGKNHAQRDSHGSSRGDRR